MPVNCTHSDSVNGLMAEMHVGSSCQPQADLANSASSSVLFHPTCARTQKMPPVWRTTLSGGRHPALVKGIGNVPLPCGTLRRLSYTKLRAILPASQHRQSDDDLLRLWSWPSKKKCGTRYSSDDQIISLRTDCHPTICCCVFFTSSPVLFTPTIVR